MPVTLVHPSQEVADLPFHPLANVFPLIEGDEFDELVRSISEVGQLEPIALFEGAILDGRNRYRACRAAGVEPRFETFRGGDPIKFVAAKNVDRRHLTSTQRALAALDLYALRAKGWNGASNLEAVATASSGIRGMVATSPSDAVATKDVADLFGVHHDFLSCVRTVLERGLPEEIEDLRSGKINGKAAHTRLRNREKGIENPPPRHEVHAGIMQVHAAIWADFRAALDGLTALPRPEDVAAVIQKNPARKRATQEKFERALEWLMAFSDAWEAAKTKETTNARGH